MYYIFFSFKIIRTINRKKINSIATRSIRFAAKMRRSPDPELIRVKETRSKTCGQF